MSLVPIIEQHVTHLVNGWKERVEYSVSFQYHDMECATTVRASGQLCHCPTRPEQRVKWVRHHGLLTQLAEYNENGDPGEAEGCERMPPNKPGSKPPGNMAGFHFMDEISCEVYTLVDKVMRESGRDPGYAVNPLRVILVGLPYQMRVIESDYPHLVQDVHKALSGWVKKARRILNHDSRDEMFADMVCGECGGGLTVARDLSTGVRCVGTLTAQPCGKVYEKDEWLDLLENG